MDDPDHLVVFTPSGKRGRFAAGTPLLGAARTLGVDIDSVCGGRGICGRCQVILSEGAFPKFGVVSGPEHLIPLTEPEERYRARKGLAPGRRLSCHCRLTGDVVIDVPPESQVHQQVVRKAAGTKPTELDPVVRLCYVEVAPMDMARPSSDLRRLKLALREDWGLGELNADVPLLQTLQTTLREGDWKVTVAVRGEDIVALWPGLRTESYGLAVDVGSTTIAAHLAELSSGKILASAGTMNPQIRFGEDLMSRVSYVMMHPGGAAELTRAVRDALNRLAAEVAAEAGIALSDILELTLVGNPVMHHLLLGIDPSELGGAPFALATGEAMSLRARDLDLLLHPSARAYVLPCIAGHVGADTAAMILSEAPHHADELTLLVDVGTNAEIVLGNAARLAACSSPTGPALEGAQISSGQRAAAGAIERVRVDRDTLEPRFKVIGCELWSDEPGFAEATEGLNISGICGSGILEVIGELFLAGVVRPDGLIDPSRKHARIFAEGPTAAYLLYAGDAARGHARVAITQADVRAVQLAKAALYAGVRLLMDHLGVATVERIALAGAFGSHIDPTYAMLLGLLPDCDLGHVRSAGNAAGDGALRALLSGAARREVEALAETVEKIETAVEPKFQAYFVAALAIPHKTDAFPKLEAALGLPDLLAQAQLETPPRPGSEHRRRRRRRGAP